MARLYLPPDRLTTDRVVLGEEAHRYLHRVLRLAPGDRLVIFDGQGHEIDAEIETGTLRGTTLRLGARREVPGPRVAVSLLQAIPKGERMDLLVQKTTELGLRRLRPVISARSVVQAGDGMGRLRRWRTISEEAARQCGRADLPVIDAPVPLATALAEAAGGGGLRLFVWEEAQGAPLRRAFAGDETEVTLLVGPEGGFEPAEALAARAAGFVAVGLGRRILRSETAAMVAVALTQAALGELD
jgi:16S rRNA (uracil1498-N3)-methyltransferase